MLSGLSGAVGDALLDSVLVSPLQFGAALSFAGDVDGDLVADIAVGAPGAFAQEGAVYLIRLNGTDSTAVSATTIGSFLGGLERSISVAS